ncbi:MAG: hypothetical protein ACE5KJ_06105 [Candidatus Zixiibacteriota bacterium]
MRTAIREIGRWSIALSGKDPLEILVRVPRFRNGGKIAFIVLGAEGESLMGVQLGNFGNAY